MHEELVRIESRLERMEGKLDNHLERVSKLEEASASQRGQIRFIMSIIVAAVSAAFTYVTGGFGK